MLRRRAFFSGRAHSADGLRDLAWFTRPGHGDDGAGLVRAGRDAGDVPVRAGHSRAGRARACRSSDDSFLAVLHAGDRPVSFVLPGPPWAARYEVVVDTSREEQEEAPGVVHRAGAAITVPARAVLLLRVVG